MNIIEIGLLPVGGKREKQTFETLKNLSNAVVDSVEKFEEGVQVYLEGDLDEGYELLLEVDKLESKADEYGFKFESELGSGAFLPAFRGDLSRLAEAIDEMADRAEESLREIYRRPRLVEDLKKAEAEDEEAEVLREGLVELAGKAAESTKSLDKAVSILMEDMDEAAERAEEVHRRERDSDIKEDELAKALYEHEDLLNPVTVMQIQGLIKRFGGISDAAEASGDILSAMTNALKA